DEVLDQRLVWQRLERHLACHEARGACVDRLSIDADHAFLAGVRVDARKADGEARVPVDADPAQAVEHGLAGLERNFIVLEAAGLSGRAAPYLQVSLQGAPVPARSGRSGASARFR